jgi:hypothetical protein
MKPITFESSGRLLLAILLIGSTTSSVSAPATLSQLPDPLLSQGLWEVVSTESMRKGFEGTESRCVGAKEQEVKLARKEFKAKRTNCEFADVVLTENLIGYTAICTRDFGVKVTGRISFKGDFGRKFVRTEVLSFDISTPMDGMTQTQQFRYKGSCPKSMKPGETVLSIRDGPTMPKWNRYNPPQPAKSPPAQQK